VKTSRSRRSTDRSFGDGSKLADNPNGIHWRVRVREIIVTILLLHSVAFALASGADPLENYYGNTWEVTRPEETLWIYVNPDKTFSLIFKGKTFAGEVWRMDGGIVCLFMPQPDARTDPHPHCFRGLEGRKVGESWKTTIEGGDKLWDCTLYKGRSVPPAGARVQSPHGGY
jgi:hypothetical protein